MQAERFALVLDIIEALVLALARRGLIDQEDLILMIVAARGKGLQ